MKMKLFFIITIATFAITTRYTEANVILFEQKESKHPSEESTLFSHVSQAVVRQLNSHVLKESTCTRSTFEATPFISHIFKKRKEDQDATATIEIVESVKYGMVSLRGYRNPDGNHPDRYSQLFDKSTPKVKYDELCRELLEQIGFEPKPEESTSEI